MENTKSRANGRQSSAASESNSKAQAGKQAKASKNASDAKGCKNSKYPLQTRKTPAIRGAFSFAPSAAPAGKEVTHAHALRFQ